MSAVSNKTTMTWDQAEEHINSAPLAYRYCLGLPNVAHTIQLSRGHVHLRNKYDDAVYKIFILGIGLFLFVPLGMLLCHVDVPGTFHWKVPLYAIGLIGMLTVVGIIISLIASCRHDRRVAAQLRQKIEADKKNPEHPFLARLLKKDLKLIAAYMAAADQSLKAASDHSQALSQRSLMISQALTV